MTTEQTPTVSRDRGATVIALGPEYENLDEPLLERLRSFILDAADRADPPRVVLDLSHTKFFGSAFLEILVQAWNRLRDRPGGRLALSGLSPYCADVVRVTRLDRVWPMYASRAEAVEQLAADSEGPVQSQ